MVVIEFTFRWKLDASLFYEKDKVYLNSPVYNCVYKNCSFYWYIRFMDSDPKRKDVSQHCLNLVYQNGSKPKVFVNVSMQLENTNNVSNDNLRVEMFLKEFEKSQSQMILLFPANITSEIIKKFADDKTMVTVVCTLQFDENTFNIRPYEPKILAVPAVGEKLFNVAINDDTLDSYYSDVILMSKDGRRFRCHKTYLSAGCEVFQTVFKNNDDESVIKLKDLDSVMITEILRFIYTNQISVNIASFAHELVQVADKYKLTDLKYHCEIAMFDCVNKTNAVTFLVVADRHELNTVRDKAVSIIVDNFFDIQENEDWSNLKSEYPNLVDLVLKDSAARANVSMRIL